jgi:hypothetical protein
MSDLYLTGAWIVTGYNYDPTPEALFDNELEARRWADLQGTVGYDVAFWPFGVEWHERWKNGIDTSCDLR